MSGHAVMDDSDETKISPCELESEHQIVTTKEALRASRLLLSFMMHIVLMRN